MSFSTDPYRTLGLVPGASLDDVKRAYRRLAKRYHPDSAGEREVARFLAIQAAYERIVGGRTSGRATSPWDADPGRARATRQTYRDRASRAGGASERRGSTSWAGGSWWSTGRPGDPAGARSTGRAGGPAGAGTSGGRREPGAGARDGHASTSDGRTGSRRKATLNSTSYDEATQQPRDPDWDGSTWYGASSGTYWTINPKEYADPRKHGPEYQARARRARVDGRWTAEADASADGPAAGPAAAPRPTGPRPRPAAATAPPGPSVDREPTWPGEPRPSSAAATIGLAAGLVTAVPSTLVLLGSGLGSGDPLLGALLAPLVVGSAAWLVATLLGRRSASSPP